MRAQDALAGGKPDAPAMVSVGDRIHQDTGAAVDLIHQCPGKAFAVVGNAELQTFFTCSCHDPVRLLALGVTDGVFQ